jgi:hypothetical protein
MRFPPQGRPFPAELVQNHRNGDNELKAVGRKANRERGEQRIMTDTMTGKPLRVLDHGSAGPYMIVPDSQLERICGLLDDHKITYEVDDLRISMNGQPEVVFIEFGRKSDAGMIQAILDANS